MGFVLMSLLLESKVMGSWIWIRWWNRHRRGKRLAPLLPVDGGVGGGLLLVVAVEGVGPFGQGAAGSSSTSSFALIFPPLVVKV